MFGVAGRRAVEERLSSLRAELDADLCIVNGENIADGVGITPKLADKLLAAGVDVITLGNHVWRRREIVPYLSGSERIVRPANLSASSVVVLDFHAEATSEKIAIARWLDGRVTAVIGTHTHVQTNDARVLPGGTAAITDAGMTGPHDSVIGVKAELAIHRMRARLPVRFEPAEGGVRIEGVVVECTDDGRATGIELLRVAL